MSEISNFGRYYGVLGSPLPLVLFFALRAIRLAVLGEAAYRPGLEIDILLLENWIFRS